MVKKTICSLVVGCMALASPVSLMASESDKSDIGVVSGYVKVDADAGIIEQDIEGSFNIIDLFNNISSGTLRGTWSHGNSNFGMSIFSSVTGSSQNTSARAEGRGTVRNGSGNEHSGDWQSPGVNSRGEIRRTVTGTNLAMWDLRAPR